MNFTLFYRISQHVKELFQDLDKRHTYHNYQHTLNVVEVAKNLAFRYNIFSKEIDALLIAAFFHDTGHLKAYEGHEDFSVEFAENYLEANNFSAGTIKEVSKLIKSTCVKTSCTFINEKILHDADLSHVGYKNFFVSAENLRKEWESLLGIYYTNEEWLQSQLDFLKKFNFLTDEAQLLFGKQLKSNLKLLKTKIHDFERKDS